MANYPSSKKAIRQNSRNYSVNRLNITKIRTALKKSKIIISSTESTQSQAAEALKLAQSALMKGVTKGVLRLNTASRRIKHLNKIFKNFHEKSI